MVIDSNGTHIYVKQRDSGELVLVFLHYYGDSARAWNAVADEPADRCRITATDRRGWNDSEAPADYYSITGLVVDAESVVEAPGLRCYVPIGHSMGGKVIQLMISRRPNNLEGLVLVTPSPPSPVLLSDAQRATLTGAYQTRESVELMTDHVLTVKPFSAAYHEQVIEDSLRDAPQAKSIWPELTMRGDITTATTSIDAPITVTSGELNQVDRVATLQTEPLPRIPRAMMHVPPGTRRLSPLEAPAEVARIIGQFVTAIGNKSIACYSPDEAPAAPDATSNAGDLGVVFGLLSNQAMM